MIGTKSLTALLVLGVLSVAGCRYEPVSNINDAPYGLSATSTPRTLTMEDYEKAVIRAGVRRGWVFERVEEGHLIGTNTVRGKHTAVVDLKFDAETYSITLNRADNLNHNASTNQIHPNYNHWVRNLAKDIRTEVQLARAS